MLDHAKVQGFSVDLLNYDEVENIAFENLNNNKNTHIVTINPEIIQSAKKNKELAKIINEAEIVTPDGIGIVLALKLKGIIQTRVTGVDLSLRFLKKCAQNSIKAGIVGASKEVVELAVKNIKKDYPNIDIAYYHHGYFENEDEIINDVIQSGAKLLLCAMGSPKQEYFISKLKQKAKGLIMIGVGGTVDVLSGNVKQAPSIYKKLGIEWLYRTIKQPKRLKRIFPALPIFFFQSIIDRKNV